MPAPLRPASPPPDSAAGPAGRREYGRYYTPPVICDALHRLLLDALGSAGLDPARTALVDPSCGPGAFLSAPAAGRYRERLGLDLDPEALRAARAALPGVRLLEGDAYREGLKSLTACLDPARPVAVIGNPPYVANSTLLRSDDYHAVRDRLLPFARGVASGTSIRDDYALFFGVADRLVERAAGGAIAFVTSASFLDNFLYAPMRGWLLSRYRLASLVELGDRLFPGTRVVTALSVWVRTPGGHGDQDFGHARLQGSVPERLERLETALSLTPARPHGAGLLLTAPDRRAWQAAERLTRAGAPIGSVLRSSLPGLKTRFEALLVDEDRGRLAARMKGLFEASTPSAFAAAHRLRASSLPKLTALFEARRATRFDPDAIHPFARYAGRPHRFRLPREAMLWAYVDPALIPRGDHRFRGEWNPHRHGPKLVFNVRETPLSAAVVEGGACVHDYRHTRFASLRLPARFAGAPQPGERASPDTEVLNFAGEWASLAGRLQEPADLLYFLCAVINSRLIQEEFAPLLGATEEVPIPLAATSQTEVVQRLALVTRGLGPGADLPDEAEAEVRALFASRAAVRRENEERRAPREQRLLPF